MQGEWMINIHPIHHAGITIKSVKHNRYLAFSDKCLTTLSDVIKNEDLIAWHLEPAHRNHFLISSKCHEKRLTCTNKHDVRTSKSKESCEKWIIEPTNDKLGHFTIRSLKHGLYLGSLTDGNLVINNSKFIWCIIPSTGKDILIQTVDHNHNLSCKNEGILISTQEEDYENCDIWNLEPILPSAYSRKNILGWTGIGLATAAAAVAAPFAVMGVIGAMGFGAGGIVGGSMAAGMMSAEALAAGGAVVAGGTVATLQSIGAVGLGMVGTSAAATTGAVAGGLTTFSVAAASGALNNEQQEIRLEMSGNQLPLCAWRMWQLLNQS